MSQSKESDLLFKWMSISSKSIHDAFINHQVGLHGPDKDNIDLIIAQFGKELLTEVLAKV